MKSSTKSKYSVVIPVFNSERIIATTVLNTVAFFEAEGLIYEIILVNDGSNDGSWGEIKRLSEQHDRILSVNLLKNYGQHAAVYCGFTYASGDYVITMDDDMQNPPGEIRHLIGKIHEGYDAVFGRFREKRHPFVRRWGSRAIGYLNSKIFGKPKGIILTNVRIVRKEVIDRIIGFKTPYPYIPGMIMMFSDSVANVDIEHRERLTGKSNYSFVKIIQLVSQLLFNYSAFPLRIFSALSFLVSFLSFCLGTFYLIKAMIAGSSVRGWTTIVVLVTFLNCFTTVLLGIFGEYLWRSISQSSDFRSYYVKEVVRDTAR